MVRPTLQKLSFTCSVNSVSNDAQQFRREGPPTSCACGFPSRLRRCGGPSRQTLEDMRTYLAMLAGRRSHRSAFASTCLARSPLTPNSAPHSLSVICFATPKPNLTARNLAHISPCHLVLLCGFTNSMLGRIAKKSCSAITFLSSPKTAFIRSGRWCTISNY